MRRSETRALDAMSTYLAKRGDDSALDGLATRDVERQLREWFGMDYALCLNSATAGLEGLAWALDLGHEAELITSDFTWGGALAPWIRRGLRPRFGMLEESTLTLDPLSVRPLANKRTRMLFVPDYLGYPADARGFREIADELGLWYIADGAYGLGHRDGLASGSLADAVVVSFGQGKPLWAGDGGAVVTSNRDLYEKLLWWTQHPARQIRELGPSLRNEFGFNYRMHPLAAIWLAQTLASQLEELRSMQREFSRVTDLFNTAGITDPIDLCARGIQPAGTHFVARRRPSVKESDIDEFLRSHGVAANAQRLPTHPMTEQGAFRAQFPRFAARSTSRRQLGLQRRFCVRLPVTDGRQASLPLAATMAARHAVINTETRQEHSCADA